MPEVQKTNVKAKHLFYSDELKRHVQPYEVVAVTTKYAAELVNVGLVEKTSDKVGKLSAKEGAALLTAGRKKKSDIEK